jgi:hypothetical protein
MERYLLRSLVISAESLIRQEVATVASATFGNLCSRNRQVSLATKGAQGFYVTGDKSFSLTYQNQPLSFLPEHRNVSWWSGYPLTLLLWRKMCTDEITRSGSADLLFSLLVAWNRRPEVPLYIAQTPGFEPRTGLRP